MGLNHPVIIEYKLQKSVQHSQGWVGSVWRQPLKSWHYEAEFDFRNVMHCKLLFKNKALWGKGKNLRIIKIIVVILNWCSICYPCYMKGHLNTFLIRPALDFRWMYFTIVVIISLCLRLLRRWCIHTHTHIHACTDGGERGNTQNFFNFNYFSFPNNSNKIYMRENVRLSRHPSK